MMKKMENNILNKEQEKNNIDKIVCETELDNAKNNFAKSILNSVGTTINNTTINPKPMKYKKWYYVKRFFNNLFKIKENEFNEY